MSVRDELSSDVAAALLTTTGAENARQMQDLLTLFRSTLRALSSEEDARRRARFLTERPHGLARNLSRGAH